MINHSWFDCWVTVVSEFFALKVMVNCAFKKDLMAFVLRYLFATQLGYKRRIAATHCTPDKEEVLQRLEVLCWELIKHNKIWKNLRALKIWHRRAAVWGGHDQGLFYHQVIPLSSSEAYFYFQRGWLELQGFFLFRWSVLWKGDHKRKTFPTKRRLR